MKLTTRFAAGATGFIFVYDVNNRGSFEHITEWMKLTDCKSSNVRVLIANKVDFPVSERKVSTEEGEAFADANGFDYFEVSAATGVRVNEVFQNIFSQVLESIPDPAEPSLLLKKGIRIGKKTLQDKNYRQSLFRANNKVEVPGLFW